ncbi:MULTISPECIES: retron St85 family RNA-directed DNA polymerase [Roseobacteraceae]|uniref:RNA-directed DNA polymerase n=1 Tax=Celeribacter baekdonensis B30 TaxID=1208323 RepID=K2K784_9RHOB|nr:MULTISPECIES: retron St85 family RNA-directed DNA polymerase [Roseobacteraceae]EKE73260.1 RNA-directed DNA polymerase [Celeribacter baekdonensis B30]
MSDIIQRIKRRFAFSDSEFNTYLNTAPFRYKNYTIPKRSGGVRLISQPSKDLKSIQRFILSEFLLPKLEIHECATAYREERNIADNARPHLQNQFLLKMDFKDFFPSIRAIDFSQYALRRSIVESEEEATMLGKIFFKSTNNGLRLSIGSPGSPPISNAVMINFDKQISSMCRDSGIAFTRYSDDLTFSSNSKGILFGIPNQVQEVLEVIQRPKLMINAEKTKFSSKKFNRHVTGITITNDGLMSLGRQTKRRVRSEVYNAPSMQPKERQRLRGYLSYAKQFEPSFVIKLWEKYPAQMALIKNSAFTKRNGDPQ